MAATPEDGAAATSAETGKRFVRYRRRAAAQNLLRNSVDGVRNEVDRAFYEIDGVPNSVDEAFYSVDGAFKEIDVLRNSIDEAFCSVAG
jgi:hypothetical protein